jgi:hypothetical protein
LQSANGHELVTEFTAIRAAQAPKSELKGIKAEAITPTFTTEPFSSPITAFDSPVASRPTSPPDSPVASEGRTLRTSKSVDSFTRVASNSFSSPNPPISPPPRRSSRQIQRMSQGIVFNALGANIESPTILDSTAPVSGNSSPKSYFGSNRPMLSPAIPIEEELTVHTSEIAQAVTTPDDSALLFISHQRTISSAGLADVPEEEEEAGESKTKELRHSRSFPSSFFKAADKSLWLNLQPEADGWPKTADPILPQHHQTEDIPHRHSRRVSHVLTGVAHTSWEDDIDYCYEHAMEAEGLEWDETWITEEAPENMPPASQPQFSNPYLRNLSATSDSTNVPSATSSSISVPGIVTPSEVPQQLSRDSTSSSNSMLFPLSPSFLIPKEFSTRVTHEETYPQKLGDADNTKHTDSFYFMHNLSVDVDVRREYSPRNSGSPISKWSSRESLSTGRTASIATGSTKHRNSSSISSVPELMVSHNSKRPTSTSASSDIDQLPIQRSMSPEPENAISDMIPPRTSSKNTPTLTSTATSDPTPRSRSNSESCNKLLDLALIGAPASAPTQARLRSGSLAAGRGTAPVNKAKGPGHRTSYSLFPTASMTSPR